MHCVGTASFSIVVNGQAEGFFVSERGLRQGFPLSPYLFILCSQGLTWLMRKMESNALYNGYRVNRSAPVVSHLMFADDLLLFGTLDNRTIETLLPILSIYAAWSGQNANMQKSAVFFSKGVEHNRRLEVAEILGVKQMESSDKYLGHQLLKSAHLTTSHDFLEEKFNSKTAEWKRIFFNSCRKNNANPDRARFDTTLLYGHFSTPQEDFK